MFATEKDHYKRRYSAAWPASGESALRLAGKLQKLFGRLSAIEPFYGDVRLILALRAFRPSDPGPILEMTTEDLASLIDRRTRFDPPQYPAPVDQDGYSMALSPNLSGHDPRSLGANLHAGQYRPGVWDSIELQLHQDSPVWRDADLGLSVLDIVVGALDCPCAAASAFISEGERGRSRPWMTWIAAGADEKALPIPFPFEEAPPSPRQAPHRDGVLRTWP